MSEQEQQETPASTEVTPGVWVLPGQGNAFAVETPVGVVLVDTGPGGKETDDMILALRLRTDAPVAAICYSHGHYGYNFGVPQWLDHNAERGDDAPRLISHRNVPLRYARYRETDGYQATLVEMQFPGISKKYQPTRVDPVELFDDHMVLSESPRIELLWVPSETDCALAMWLPDTRTLYAGASVPADMIPNIGTPLRTLRLTVRWAETLERLVDLRAARLVVEFGPVVEGEEAIAERLATTAEALRWLRTAVVDRLNRGMGEREILADLDYPPELFDLPWLKPIYGSPDYVVRDLVREESGWWDRNPTSLHPAAPADVARATFDAIADPDAVIARAEALTADGQVQLAMHVIDLVALGPDDEPAVTRARTIKADLCRARSKEIDPYPSKGLYKSSARLLRAGTTSWEGVIE
jgi:alkyl sulfatase BDS1-like metallo-beta-lactamase superfamily hydrolase